MNIETLLPSPNDSAQIDIHLSILGGTASVFIASDPFHGEVSFFLRSREDRPVRVHGGLYRFAAEIVAANLVRGRVTPVADRVAFEPMSAGSVGIADLFLQDPHHGDAVMRQAFCAAVSTSCAPLHLSPDEVRTATDRYFDRSLGELGRKVTYYADRLLDTSANVDFLRSDLNRIDTIERRIRQVVPHASAGFGFAVVTQDGMLVKFGQPACQSASGVLAGAVLPAGFALEVAGRRLSLTDDGFLAADLSWTTRYGRLRLLRLQDERIDLFDPEAAGYWTPFDPTTHLHVGETT